MSFKTILDAGKALLTEVGNSTGEVVNETKVAAAKVASEVKSKTVEITDAAVPLAESLAKQAKAGVDGAVKSAQTTVAGAATKVADAVRPVEK